MTAIATRDDTPQESDRAHADDHHEHPPDAFYWKVAGILALLTAIEVSTFWWKDWFGIPAETAGRVTGPVLIVFLVRYLWVTRQRTDLLFSLVQSAL